MREGEEGTLTFLGRRDDQIKLRGYRIELGEIEEQVRHHGGVREAVVQLWQEEGEPEQLVGYVVPWEMPGPGAQQLREALETQVPAYMLPSAWVQLERLPLTSNGKLDRQRLPRPERESQATPERREEARTPVEELMLGIWEEVLGRKGLGRQENFFLLGGHSLLGTRLIARVRAVFGVEVPIPWLFEAPTIAQLTALLQREVLSGKGLAVPAIMPRSQDEALPLSFAQQRLWFLDQLEPGQATYNVPTALKLKGSIVANAFEQSLQEVVNRHEVLRTTFATRDGQPVQIIHPTNQANVTWIDLSQLVGQDQVEEGERLAQLEAQLPFDLERGPVLRMHLVRLSIREHIMLMTMHHCISDAWSRGIFSREMLQLYQAFSQQKPNPLAPLPVQYADYALWQRSWLQGAVLQQQMDYWKEHLAGIVPLELPTDHPRPPIQTFRGASAHSELPASMSAALLNLSRQHGVTLFMTLLAAFQVLLARYSGQDDIAVGTPIANRSYPEVEGLIGFFVNTLVMRADLSGNPSFVELLSRVRVAALGAYGHQDLPFERLVEELQPSRDLQRSPLFQVMFILQHKQEQTLEDTTGLELEGFPEEKTTSKFDLTLALTQSEEGIYCNVEYCRDLFEERTIERLLTHWQVLLEGIVSNPQQCIADLPLLTSEEERLLLVDWNQPVTASQQDSCAHQLFEGQVEARPDAVAIVHADKQLTYQALNQHTNQLAHYLQSLGVGPDITVGVCMERSPEMVMGVLAIFKAGGVCVPLDPTYPEERLALMVEDARIAVLLTQQRLHGKVPARQATTVCLDIDWASIASFPTANPQGIISQEQLAYVIYTSGSTGRPKGTGLPHRTLSNLFRWHLATLLTEARMLQFASLGFDVSFMEIFSTLGSGGTLLMADEALRQDIIGLADFLSLMAIEKVILPVVVLHQLAEEYTRREASTLYLKEVTTTGEQMQITSSVIKLFQTVLDCPLHNHYGPSESHVITAYTLSGAPSSWVAYPPIGRPISQTQIHLLDSAFKPVPIGVPGELYIGGVSLARGYIHQPGLTAERFIPNPLSSIPGERLYRTGDKARYLEGGDIEYLGRLDHQVKLRGYRIELSEIEATISRYPGIGEVVVQLVGKALDDKRLIAYLVPTREHTIKIQALRQHLRQQLPEYMLPSAFVELDALPLTTNGKVDRRALPLPDISARERGASLVAPRTAIEEVIAGTWRDVLGIQHIDMYDNFFEVGGHSLLAMRVISRIRAVLQMDIPLRVLFEEPTIAGLAQHVEATLYGRKGLEVPALEPRRQTDDIPLSFAQQRLWFLEQLQPDTALYSIPTAIRLQGRLEIQALHQSLQEMIRRHETLRTTFHVRYDQPVQIIAPTQEAYLPLLDLRACTGQERQTIVEQLMYQEAGRPFNLAEGPLLRTILLRLDEEEHALLFTMHHIVSDGWSMEIFIREMTALYVSFAMGRALTLPPLPIQYADFALWQRQWLQGHALEEQMRYWQDQLAALTPLELPTDYPRPAVMTFRGARQSLLLPPPLRDDLQSLSQREGATLFMTLLAAFQHLLARYSGQDDIAVGTPIANRTHAALEGLIGFFINTLVLRADLTGNPTFQTLLARVREVCLGAYAHQDIPFEKLVEVLQPERDRSRSPLFQVSFSLQQAQQEAEALEVLPQLSVSGLAREGLTTKFDLMLNITDTQEGLRCTAEYSTDLFAAETIDRLLQHFHVLLQEIVSQPQLPLAQLALLTPAENQQMLIEWNQAQVTPQVDLCLHQLIEAQAERTPDQVAVTFEGGFLSYAALNQRANQLAHFLRSTLQVGPDVPVGIYMERSFEVLVAMLAILKAGGAYVPLDPSQPQERVSFIREDTQLTIILTQGHLRTRLSQQAARILCLDSDWPSLVQTSTLNPAAKVSPDNLAYIIYTSGSTGRPKGVLISHRNVVHSTLARHHYYADPVTSYLLLSPFTFDSSVAGIFWTLTQGGTLVLPPAQLRDELLHISEIIARLAVSHVLTVPSLYTLILQQASKEQLRSLRTVIVAGEACAPSLSQLHHELYAEIALFNEYGPTEGTVWSSVYHDRPQGVGATVPIGRPVPNVQLYLVDLYQQPVPVGVAGELCIGGAGLARGYLHHTELTAEKFIPHPFSEQPGQRIYRTGDLARYLPDGTLEFLGRVDQQVKIRGYRIELGEIEATLQQHPVVRECAVVVHEDEASQKHLIAYVAQQTAEIDTTDATVETEHVSLFQTVYDQLYSQEQAFSAQDEAINTNIWTSSYTNTPLPVAEVLDSVNGVVERVAALQPERSLETLEILEIGCGTGLLLFRLAPQCRQYSGVDLSEAALRHLRAQLAAREPEFANVTLAPGAAHEVSQMGFARESFDVVILNEVVQHFPNLDYFERVLEQITPLVKKGGSIFIGGLRSLSLLTTFHTSVQIYRAAPSLPIAQMQERIRELMSSEKDFVIDPAYFALLHTHLPQLSLARVQLKSSDFPNEITRFKYDVVLQVGERKSALPGTTPWLDWSEQALTVPKLRIYLQASKPANLGIKQVPNARLLADARAVELLARKQEELATVRDVQAYMQNVPGATGIDPQEIWALGQELSYLVDICWSSASDDGSFNILFRRQETPNALPFPPEELVPRKSWSDYVNNPAHKSRLQEVEPELRHYMQDTLPEYMIPSRIVMLDALPRTFHGKVDRRTLAALNPAEDEVQEQLATPRNPLEEIITEVWKEVLHSKQVGIHENFFQLGGHSLLATQMVSRLRSVLQIEVPLHKLFETPTIAGLARVIEQILRQGQSTDLSPIQPVSREEALPLSFAQQRLWFLHQLDPQSTAYTIPNAVRLRGSIDIQALDLALHLVIQRHESLRTTFPSQGAVAVQHIGAAPSSPLTVLDLRSLPPAAREPIARSILQQHLALPFDLAHGPLLRSWLLQLDSQDQVLLLSMHHIISDGWSSGILTQELIQLYQAASQGLLPTLPPLPIQYADYALWQRQWLQGPVLQEQLSYWKTQLAGITPLTLPTDAPRPAIQRVEGARLHQLVPLDLLTRLQALSQRQGVTLFMTLLAAFQVLLARLSGQQDIAVGTPIANRTRDEVEGLIGFFVNTLVLRCDLSGTPSFLDLLTQVRQVCLQAYAHQDLPFEQVVEAVQPQRDRSRSPLFQVLFSQPNLPTQAEEPLSLATEEFRLEQHTSKFELQVVVAPSEQGLRTTIEYATALFAPATIARLLRQWQLVLEQLLDAPEQPIGRLCLLSQDERDQLLHYWNQAQEPLPPLSVQQLFEAQVARTPERIALICAEEQLSYATLNARANQLARTLRAQGVGPEVLVGLCLSRTPELLVALLAVLKAGEPMCPSTRPILANAWPS
ncbi:hypothetical protein KSD_77680 [Ktedonobacter sp. SOSP1-85]|nr:hypothetical protein KSD_77680 [Ktedonobacter sp. SOSP1-85]